MESGSSTPMNATSPTGPAVLSAPTSPGSPVSPGLVQRSFSEQFLTCSICLEHYREPRQLECLHSFCTPCLELIFEKHRAKRKFPCPMCLRTYNFPEGGARGLRLDFRYIFMYVHVREQNVGKSV